MRPEMVCTAGEEYWERYSLGMLSAPEVESLEEHLLVCPRCQDRLREMDAYVAGMRGAARALQAEEQGGRAWNRLVIPRPAVIWAALALIVAGAAWWRYARPQGPPVAVLLQTARDSRSQTAPAGRPLTLAADITEVVELPVYRVEVVDSSGRRVAGAAAARQGGHVSLPIPRGLPPGGYFVRLYAPSGELLREYAVRLH